jgi:amidase
MALASGAAVSWGTATPAGNSPSKDISLHYASLLEVANLIKAGDLRPTVLAEMQLERIAAIDPGLHSYVTVMADQAMESARQANAEIAAGRYRGPLHGVPIGIKDLCFTKGVRTMAGTRVLADFIPEYDATVVARLEAAGAVILGELTLCEGAHGPYHPELEVPVNPWDAQRWSGVSSSGNGVATAAGLCFGSVGTDTGGSIRYPSAANGCVGLKPTYGRVSRYGVFALAASMDHVGPMTRTVADAALMFEAMAGYDSHDPTSLSEPVPDVRAELGRGVAGLRIGFDRRYASHRVDPDVTQAVSDVVAGLKNLGAEIVEVEMPKIGSAGLTWYNIETVEALIANAQTFPSRADEYGPGFRTALEYGQQVSATTYASAMMQRAEYSARLYRTLAGIDCLVCPSLATAARTKSVDPTVESDEDWNRLVPNDVFTYPFNFAGVPTLSVPCGFSADGLPLSVQFVASRLDEAMLCRVGYACEQAMPWHLKHPPL